MAGARLIIEGPAFSGMPYGLWDSVQHPATDGTPHWMNGVTWQDFCPTPSASFTTYDACAAVTGTGGNPSAPANLAADVTRTDRGATPFTLYAEYDGSPVGLDAAGVRAEAETQLARIENTQAEAAFWTGLAGGQPVVWPHLAANAVLLDSDNITLQTAASPLVTGGSNVTTALGQLEYQLAQNYGGQGYIHVPRSVLPLMTAWKLLDWTHAADGVLCTKAGNRVVVGGGYPGTSPAGATPASGTSWIYATGAVFGYRSDIVVREMPGTFDRSKNTVKRQALRTYLFGWECAHFAALVNLGVTTNTSG